MTNSETIWEQVFGKYAMPADIREDAERRAMPLRSYVRLAVYDAIHFGATFSYEKAYQEICRELGVQENEALP